MSGTYFQERYRAFEILDTAPEFMIFDGGPAPVLGQDFAAYPGLNATSGEADCPLRFMRLGPPNQSSPSTGWRAPYPDLEHADYSDETLVVLSDNTPYTMTGRTGRCGMIVIAPEGVDLSKRYTLSGRSGMGFDIDWNLVGEEKPYIWISQAMGERILAMSDIDLEELAEETSQLGSGEVFTMPLEGRATFSLQGTIYDKVPVRNVMGYIPGWHGYDLCADCLGKRTILVLVQYDSPPIGPDGTIYPAANDNASGVAVMLELIRLIQETDYYPPKTFYFAAYGGEGLDNGEPVGNPPEINELLQARPALLGLEIEAIVLIRGVGAGSGERIEISAGGSLRLAQLFERAARNMDTRLVRLDQAFDISVIYYDSASFTEVGEEAPTIKTYWEGWWELSRSPADTLENISEDKLDQVGRTLALVLMILGQETNY